ncbi:hypothetical protein BOTBODRAFT_70842 [Botryobasidium botryosum FD-172 SS1]|uniref:Uncharacterized protein n=1 Tax=Botryobasidium botryosum (strain FD-172 SS1) TaxID=930990 RepID=A0A067LU97_BOTB1|nr:hypothetical protein BOTBODRAFT_70842 [Botryobasidium botryosum FD-172 SS1]
MSDNPTPFYERRLDTDIDEPGPESEHERVGAWFLGPKAENHEFLQRFFRNILEQHKDTRTNTFVDDPPFVTKQIQASSKFSNEIFRLEQTLRWLTRLLAQNSVPFWSPRYNGHMNMDVSMPGVLGYLTTMLFNPNNTAVEAGPLTTLIEKKVGLDLCVMLGYNPVAWGHVTCGGTLANLESMWAARNMKFYPLSLANAIAPGAPLSFVSGTFRVTLCTGVEKLYKDCTTWELLNLTPDVILDLPDRLQKEYRISSEGLTKIMSDYIIQTVGKDVLEKQFGVKLGKYFVATTKHYSWPKGAAITGIGSTNLIEVSVDNAARMKVDALDEYLKGCLRDNVPIYAVVAIMGSTEHGAVDPLSSICGLRQKYQRLGLSFVVHADGAWGGYFASTLELRPVLRMPGYVPRLALGSYIQNEIRHYRFADSFTIDPHKSGYLPYPGGALCYRDERMRYLITWSAPYLGGQSKGVESMGVYGVEGSKPGAAPVGIWLSHEIIGLNTQGYGALIGEAVFSAAKMYSHWTIMDLDHPSLVLVPFNMLPTEKEADSDPKKVMEQRKYIRDRIAKQSNYDLRHDDEAWNLIRELGSDLLINAFACNFKIGGKVNEDVVEANYMNRRIYEKLSMTGIKDLINPAPSPPLVIMNTVMEQGKCKDCLTNFKRRLGLDGVQDLTVLSNLSYFTSEIASAFQEVAEDVIKECVFRNEVKPDFHKFILLGTETLFLVHMPKFNKATHRRQLIVEVEIPSWIMVTYLPWKESEPTATFTLATVGEEDLSAISASPSTRFSSTMLGSKYLDEKYPDQMPPYLFSSPYQTYHIDHMLLRSPNIQITADVTVDTAFVAVIDTVPEWLMQPISSLTVRDVLKPGEKLSVTIYRPIEQAHGPGLIGNLGYPAATGTVTIGEFIYAHSTVVNEDPKQDSFGAESAPKGWEEVWDDINRSRSF